MNRTEQARSIFMQALDHHSHQRLAEAERLYRDALALVPDRLSVLVNLTAVLIAQERLAEARVFCRRALEIDPRHPDSLEHLALCVQAAAAPEDRIEAIGKALGERPSDAGLHNNLGVLLHDCGRHLEARESFDRSIALDPSSPGTLVNRARALEAMELPQAALHDYRQALAHSPGFDQAGQGFINLVINHGLSPAASDSAFDTLLVHAIERPWAAPQFIAPVLHNRIAGAPGIRQAIARSRDAWPTLLPLAQCVPPVDSASVLAHPLLLAQLRSALVTDIATEMLLINLRHAFLTEVVPQTQADYATHMLGVFHCALAMQCFLNEYVYTVTAAELARTRSLDDRIAVALCNGSDVPAHWLVASACYAPLHTLPGADKLLDMPWPVPVEALLEQQLRQPLRELQLRPTIPAITPVRGQTSVRVRRQYEENPYPRWSSLPRYTARQSPPDFIRRRVRGSRDIAWPAGPAAPFKALNAGCGTGQHPADMALRMEGIHLLAVDLSLSSLSYAKRMAEQLGLRNIEFAQADILELGVLPDRFDLIECSGVLHHMSDPGQGLAVLCGLLRDNGLMRLALYSQDARRSVAACRQDIMERGYRPTAPDIRRYRTWLMSLDGDDPRKAVMAFTDFYSMSECRDLLFHVQEHRFTLPLVQVLLDTMSLSFLGFELDPGRLADFGRAFPGPASLGNLDAWHAYERRNPDTFAGMYTFWVQKGTSRAARA